MKTISSRQNPIVRTFREARDAADTQRLLLDGAHLVHEARATGAELDVVVVAASRLDAESEEGRLAAALARDGVEVVAATDQVFAAISPVRSPTGIVALARRPATVPAAMLQGDRPFILAAVDVQDPGNVGSLLRAAEAGGVTGAFICGRSASPFSWKAVRGSMGSVLRLPVVAGMAADAALACMQRAGLRTIAAVPRDGRDPDAIDWRGRVGLLLGGEGPGLAAGLADACDARVTIPMAPAVESLNVAVAGAILVYAARRQRI